MPATTSPFFGINYGWTTGEGAWGEPVNANFKALSFLGKGAVDSFVASLPLSPSDGDSVVLTTDNQFYVRIGGNWLFIQPQDGMEVNETSTGKRWQYSGNWVEIPTTTTLKSDLANSADPSKGSGMVGYLPGSNGVVGRSLLGKLRETISVLDFPGVDPTGVTDSTDGIQAALNSITNQVLTTQQRSGGATLFFPEGIYKISKPLVVKSVNTILAGAGQGTTIIQATTGAFAADVGPDLLGKWMVIWDAAYVLSGDDLYNCHIFDMSLDFNNRTDLKGIWIGGGRNSSSIERIQFIRFYTHLIELGKSSRDLHSITQGVLVSNCLAIWDGNVGQHTVDRDGLLFVISSGNENVFFNVDIASGAGETSIGTGFMVGNGSYQCGGNRFIGCGITNFKAAHITVSNVAGFLVGEVITTGDVYKGTISSIVGSTLKVITLSDGTSRYVPRAADTIVGGTSGANTTIVSAVFGKGWHLGNSWGTVVESPKNIENSVCGVFLDHSDATKCTQNVVRGGRFYSFTASCFVAFGRSQFNRCESDIYTSRVAVLVGAQFATTQFYTVSAANASAIKFVSTDSSNSALEYLSIGGVSIRNSNNSAVFSGKAGTGGVRVDTFRTDLFDANQVRLLDRLGNVRVATENSDTGNIAFLDSAGTRRVFLTSDGVIVINSAPGKSVILQQNGVSKIVLDGSGQIQLFGLTTAVPGAANALYKDVSDFVKITPP